MFYRKNIGGGQQLARVVAGAAIAGAAYTWLTSAWAMVGVASGLGFALTGLVGFCPMCAMAGIRRQER